MSGFIIAINLEIKKVTFIKLKIFFPVRSKGISCIKKPWFISFSLIEELVIFVAIWTSKPFFLASIIMGNLWEYRNQSTLTIIKSFKINKSFLKCLMNYKAIYLKIKLTPLNYLLIRKKVLYEIFKEF